MDIKSELIELGYTPSEVEQITGEPIEDVAESAGAVVLPDNSTVYSELRAVADRRGISVESYAYRTVKRVLEKVAGGMGYSDACKSAGIHPSDVQDMAKSDPGLKDMLLGLRHRFEMQAMGAIQSQIREGDGKLALELLSRQTQDFQPAKNKIEIDQTINLRDNWINGDELDGEE